MSHDNFLFVYKLAITVKMKAVVPSETLLSTRPYGVEFHKTVIFVDTAVRTPVKCQPDPSLPSRETPFRRATHSQAFVP
jgi:hypothetical protein